MSVCQKLTDVYIFVMLLIFPLFTGFRGYTQITDSKFFFLLSATLLWIVLLVVFSVLERKREKGKNSLLPSLRPSELAALAFAAVCTVSALVSPFFPETLPGAGRWDGLLTLLLYVLILLCARRFGRLRAAHLYAAGVSLLFQTGIVLLQLLDRNPLGLFPGGLRWSDANLRYSGVFLGTIGNVDLLASYLCLFIPLFCGAYMLNARCWPLLTAASPAILLLLYSDTAAGPVSLLLAALPAMPFLLDSRCRLLRFCVVLSVASFSCAVFAAIRFQAGTAVFQPSFLAAGLLCAALLCAAAAYLLHRRRACTDRSRRFYFRGVFFAELLLLVAALAVLWFWPGKSGTVHELHCVLRGDVRESFGSSRIRIWREALALVPQRPLLGGGPGTIANRLNINFERFVPETGQTLRSFVDNAHNVYLGLLTDTGALGLLAYLSIIGCSIAEILKRRREPVRLLTGLALLCGWIADFFGLGLCLTAPLLWLLWGLSGSTERPDAPEGSRRPAEPG